MKPTVFVYEASSHYTSHEYKGEPFRFDMVHWLVRLIAQQRAATSTKDGKPRIIRAIDVRELMAFEERHTHGMTFDMDAIAEANDIAIITGR